MMELYSRINCSIFGLMETEESGLSIYRVSMHLNLLEIVGFKERAN